MKAGHARPLPEGLVVTWYGDDFTGSAAVMEVLTFSGLDSVLFFDVPTPAQLARFAHCRGIGIAGAARSKSPAWMDEALPPVFEALAALRAPVAHYKVCSTFDSAPEVGSIGRAVEIAGSVFPAAWYPLLPAAPPIHRYQAFGNLFASVGDTGYRIDRHPTMSRHPVTPMREADVRRHLAAQTDLPIGIVDLVAMKAGRAEQTLRSACAAGARIIALDVVDEETLAEAGALIWEHGGSPVFAIGSQGVEYALVEYWRAAGLLRAAEGTFKAQKAKQTAVVSGSCSPVTAGQIDWAEQNGFRPIPTNADLAVDAGAWRSETDRVTREALRILSEGGSPIIYTARGADDPAIERLKTAIAATGTDPTEVNARLGEGLGRTLDTILRTAAINRAVIAGGDTSSHGALALGVYALTALAPTVPGAALFKAHSDDPALAGLELALKGGQMGGPDYFGRIRDGGGLLQ